MEAFAAGVFYDGLDAFNPEMRSAIYHAPGMRITVGSNGTMMVDYTADPTVVRLTREVEGYAQEVEQYRGKLKV